MCKVNCLYFLQPVFQDDKHHITYVHTYTYKPAFVMSSVLC